ncbi:M20 family metallo-hydrolase [Carboxylicivirga mesophila]|uniref:M20 family metallo-hydrolase n=1 Tax=Carboxylicivirga mesophila TaxID=1166478 RepID=A0ABS5K9J0_9BACT|nr:M20 family metallo-hydrolase [Carboxylicivirga mesophila]MBS2211679.1 M20 family metallo-hydrolase [Carboxylicivirga mesophila]
MTDKLELYSSEAIELLKVLISTRSFSREEDEVATIMYDFLKQKGLQVNRQGNNVWCWAKAKDATKPTVLLNSHLDTVKPSSKWTYQPVRATLEGDKLTGLGSNDAGGPLVALMAAFLCLKDEALDYNLVFAATAEEEISGANGVASILPELGKIDLGIVGEPTQMQMAVAEKGLMVLDCEAHGRTGHAAREEGDNALYKALKDIEWFRTYKFEKVSPHLGPVKMTVTQIEAGSQHNVVPDSCRFVVDVRFNECYSNVELHQFISSQVECDVKPRSYRLNSSAIALNHPLVKRGIDLGLSYYGSPTTSDQAVMNFTTVKIGCGDSARSHTPDEYIYLSEIKEGVEIYYKLLNGLCLIDQDVVYKK